MIGNIAAQSKHGEHNPSGWGWILFNGVVLIVAGVISLANPLYAGAVTGVFLGAALIVYGLLALASAFAGMSSSSRVLEILLALIAIAAGAAMIFDPLAGTASLAWTLGAWLLLAGFFQVVHAVRNKHVRGWRLLTGCVDILLGGFLFVSGPATGIALVAAALGISFLIRGAFMCMFGLELRRATRT